jgi:curved DNA-binding protein CbpA
MKPSDHTHDYYAILDVAPSASSEEIIKAYKKLVARYHPDRHQGNELEELAQEKLAQINEAYSVLSHTQKRNEYDRLVRGKGRFSANPTPRHKNAKRAGPPSYLRPIMVLVTVAAGGFLLRFMRNPRAFAMVVGLIGTIWLSSVLVKKYYDD